MLKGTKCMRCGSKLKKGKFYCSIQCRNKDKTMPGNKNPNWKGGRLRKTNGYIIVLQTNHPYCSIDGYVLEHRLVMEKHLGRILLPTEIVHHINGINNDNRIENLMLFSSSSKHSKFHYKHNKKGRYN